MEVNNNPDNGLNNLPIHVQKAIYEVFSSSPIREKIIFISKAKYGFDSNFKELADPTGMTIQRIQGIYDNMLFRIQKKSYEFLGVSGHMSGVLI